MYFYLKLCHGMSAHNTHNRIKLKWKWERKRPTCMSLSLIHIIFTLTNAHAHARTLPLWAVRYSSYWYTLWHGITVNVCTKWQNGEKSNRTASQIGSPLCKCVRASCYFIWGVIPSFSPNWKLNELNAQICSKQRERERKKNNYIIEMGNRKWEKRLGFSNRKFKCFFGRNFPQHRKHIVRFFFGSPLLLFQCFAFVIVCSAAFIA